MVYGGVEQVRRGDVYGVWCRWGVDMVYGVGGG